jgi:hypothetical protein
MHDRIREMCGHGRPESVDVDPRFTDDDFTQAAVGESRARAAHTHVASMVLALLGGFLFVGLAKAVCGGRR